MIGVPYTFTVASLAIVLAVIIGVAAGSIGAIYQNKLPDYMIGFVILTGLVLPNFLVAPILQLVFGVKLGWLPVAGWGNGALRNLVLPVIVLTLPHAARISRLMRGSIIEVMNANYIRTARAKGHRSAADRHAPRDQTGLDAGRLVSRPCCVLSAHRLAGGGNRVRRCPASASTSSRPRSTATMAWSLAPSFSTWC
jgi:hypothetical protein